MRLEKKQIDFIKNTIQQIFGSDISIWLFGSRVDDSKKGGDIDLFVETQRRVSLTELVNCKVVLKEYFDLKVDILIKNPGENKPIFGIAKETGIIL